MNNKRSGVGVLLDDINWVLCSITTVERVQMHAFYTRLAEA